MRDPYQILGVPKTAGGAEIKSAFRKLAKKFHPDHNSKGKEQFQKISEAYNLLSRGLEKFQIVKASRADIEIDDFGLLGDLWDEFVAYRRDKESEMGQMLAERNVEFDNLIAECMKNGSLLSNSTLEKFLLERYSPAGARDYVKRIRVVIAAFRKDFVAGESKSD